MATPPHMPAALVNQSESTVANCHQADGHAPMHACRPGRLPAGDDLKPAELRSRKLHHDDWESNDIYAQTSDSLE